MTGFEEAVYRELDQPEDIGVYTLGKGYHEEQNEWFDEILEEFENAGAETEGYWLGLGGQDVDYDVEANVFEHDFSDPINEDVKLLYVPRPSVYRFNPEAPGDNPLDNYKTLARKVGGDLDAVFMRGIEEDAAGQMPSTIQINNMSNQLNGLKPGANLVTMKSESTGEEALLVKSSRFPYYP